jgi:hypothetical protein
MCEIKYYIRVKEEKNILHRIKRRKVNWIGHILSRKCLLKHIGGRIEGRIVVKRIRGMRRKQLLKDVKETRVYCKLKGEALYRALWRTHFGRGDGPVVRLKAE